MVFQQAIWDFGPHRLRKRQYVVEKKPRWSSVSLLQLELHCTHTYEAYMSLTYPNLETTAWSHTRRVRHSLTDYVILPAQSPAYVSNIALRSYSPRYTPSAATFCYRLLFGIVNPNLDYPRMAIMAEGLGPVEQSKRHPVSCIPCRQRKSAPFPLVADTAWNKRNRLLTTGIE